MKITPLAEVFFSLVAEMYTVEKLRELGFYVWTDGKMVYTKRWARGPIDKTLISNLLAEMKKNKANVQ